MVVKKQPDHEDRLMQCEDALAEGIKFKVLGPDSSQAIRPFEEAHRLANLDPRLPPPWPQIAAYRLAHIRMRSARTFEELAAVEELLQEAGRIDVEGLGPVPRLYRIAALHRMAQVAPTESDAAVCMKAQSKLFAALSSSARDLVWRPDPRSRAAVVQGTVHNYLELASYFTGEPYDRLQGMSSPTGDLLLKDEWRVIGSHGVGRGRHVRLPYPLARAELDARVSSGAVDLAFELGKISVRESGRVWRIGQDDLQVPLRPLLLLMKLCRYPDATRVELERSVIRAGEEGGTGLNTVASRLRRALGRYAKINGHLVLLRGTRAKPARLNPRIRVAGLVHAEMIDVSPPRLGRYERESHE